MEFLEHALIDSLKVFITVFIFHVIFSFLEKKISSWINNKKSISPLLGSLFGLIPQCGFSILAADMYLKQHITMGTVVAVFIACSDEAFPIMFSDISKIHLILPMIVLKFVIGFLVGFLVDLIINNQKSKIHHHLEHCEHEKEIHVGCCKHEIDNEKDNKIQTHIVHPLIHSLKILVYVFIVNIVFGFIIQTFGEDTFKTFLTNSKYFGPLISILIGLIPNCASSVIIADLFLMESISFGTAVSGLIVNAGLGTIVLLKNKEKIKDTLIISGILILTALIVGYSINLIIGF